MMVILLAVLVLILVVVAAAVGAAAVGDSALLCWHKLAMTSPHIYMCYKTKDVPAFVTWWETLNPGYTVHLYDDQDCEDFLRREYGEKHAQFFRSIPDGPIRSDFWRVCVLYKRGGVYVDADVEPLVPIGTFWRRVSPSHGLSDRVVATVHNVNAQFIMSTPRHPILRECMDSLLRRRPIFILGLVCMQAHVRQAGEVHSQLHLCGGVSRL